MADAQGGGDVDQSLRFALVDGAKPQESTRRLSHLARNQHPTAAFEVAGAGRMSEPALQQMCAIFAQVVPLTGDLKNGGALFGLNFAVGLGHLNQRQQGQHLDGAFVNTQRV